METIISCFGKIQFFIYYKYYTRVSCVLIVVGYNIIKCESHKTRNDMKHTNSSVLLRYTLCNGLTLNILDRYLIKSKEYSIQYPTIRRCHFLCPLFIHHSLIVLQLRRVVHFFFIFFFYSPRFASRDFVKHLRKLKNPYRVVVVGIDW